MSVIYHRQNHLVSDGKKYLNYIFIMHLKFINVNITELLLPRIHIQLTVT
jgi:hypothetical protein